MSKKKLVLMKADIDKNSVNNKILNKWYSCAVSTAVIGAVFSFIVLVLLVSNFIRTSVILAQREQELVDLKKQIQDESDMEYR